MCNVPEKNNDRDQGQDTQGSSKTLGPCTSRSFERWKFPADSSKQAPLHISKDGEKNEQASKQTSTAIVLVISPKGKILPDPQL